MTAHNNFERAYRCCHGRQWPAYSTISYITKSVQADQQADSNAPPAVAKHFMELSGIIDLTEPERDNSEFNYLPFSARHLWGCS